MMIDRVGRFHTRGSFFYICALEGPATAIVASDLYDEWVGLVALVPADLACDDPQRNHTLHRSRIRYRH